MERLDKEGRIIYSSKGYPRLKLYLDEMPGVPLQDVWTDIRPVQSQSNERLGYPTQKPESLLERIIGASSNEGDWVLDPFCGCGTAIAAAEKLKRHWIGMDITWLAVNLMKTRVKEMFPDAKFELEGEPRDMGAAKELAKNRYQFQWWALSLIGARPVGAKEDNPLEGKKGADEGIDGWLRFRDGEKVENIVVQVKSGHVSVKDIREHIAVVARQKAAMGVFITLSEPTSDMIKEAKTEDPYMMKALRLKFPKIQIVTIEQLLRGIKAELPETASAFEQAVLAKRVSSKANYRLDDAQMQS
jgi:site-specific DNA-methyltransferase (adenine-specific)